MYSNKEKKHQENEVANVASQIFLTLSLYIILCNLKKYLNKEIRKLKLIFPEFYNLL